MSEDFHRPMDEQERKHCLIDLHGVGGDNYAKAAFVTKWAALLETLLRYPKQHEDEAAEDAITEKDEAEEALEAVRSKVDDAYTQLNETPIKQKHVQEAKRLLAEALSE